MENSIKDEVVKRSFDYLDKVSSNIGDILNNLGAKLGVASERVYTVLVQQQITIGIIDIVEFLFFLAACFIYYSLIGKRAIRALNNAETEDSIAMGVVMNIPFLILTITTIVSAFDVPEAIGRFTNPEYYAIEYITNFITDFVGGTNTNGTR